MHTLTRVTAGQAGKLDSLSDYAVVRRRAESRSPGPTVPGPSDRHRAARRHRDAGRRGGGLAVPVPRCRGHADSVTVSASLDHDTAVVTQGPITVTGTPSPGLRVASGSALAASGPGPALTLPSPAASRARRHRDSDAPDHRITRPRAITRSRVGCSALH